MEKEQRKLLRDAVVRCRRLLEREVQEQLEGLYNILPDGTILADAPGDPVVRARLLEVVQHHRSGGAKPKEAVERVAREAAFTTLNRFAALKIAERRGLVRECISRGLESEGIRELADCAPGLRAALPDGGYRLLVESVMDEISLDLRVLFDRRDPLAPLWPRPSALEALLEILNAPELANFWSEDEAIGWIFQYFNADDVKEMRDASSVPRNSRELAVRNQFFTPRYVVQFLVDNTLGRQWLEMMRGETRLRDLDYLVRRQHEVFLAEGDPMPEETPQDGESPEHPYPIRFRAKKDPRDFRILDPACGSGHFLLYAFDLLLTIYEEAWADASAARSAVTGHTLHEDYPKLEALRTAAPELILRHNLHGIEIDPRAAQVAALALWLRAQRAYQEAGLPAESRPSIRKTNMVVAEPMPGDKELRKSFLQSLDPKLAKLVTKVFDGMALAGEAGYLLRIAELTEEWIRTIYGTGGVLFREEDEGHWSGVAKELRTALESFVAQATADQSLHRQLFAGDAAQCLGFIDVCSQRYDVILMNPPFGAFSVGLRDWVKGDYPRTKNDIYAAFVERGIELLHRRSRLGAISSRTGFFLSSFQRWREEILLTEAPPTVVADLGYGVMDDAMVEAAAYCLEAAE